ncbi:hypothetical protein KUTeg_018610 [Tegillarca granosa]|uniref:NADP-dependent oxidoreductase domain-containing protein n=1 Tax=Tegillarca granosa TaxID=220873 RepID=A0ABQ9EEU1_TEGGR|nr:hypothetical protein KUTeg_018610 [Tegillarca granosa]
MLKETELAYNSSYPIHLNVKKNAGSFLYLGKTISQVSLRWLIQKNVVSSVIFGATSIQQLEDNMGASGGWSLTLEELFI